MPDFLRINLVNGKGVKKELEALRGFATGRQAKRDVAKGLRTSVVKHIRAYPMDIGDRGVKVVDGGKALEIKSFGVSNKWLGRMIKPVKSKFLTVPADFSLSEGRYKANKRRVFKRTMLEGRRSGRTKLLFKNGVPIAIAKFDKRFKRAKIKVIAWLRKQVKIRKDKKVLPSILQMRKVALKSLQDSFKRYLIKRS